ncbi:MAG: glycosyltransferase family 39 protein [Verrucomicrobia bacterium]|nr:glycosyltransferase family 39 protein [Verrucomicrobiota bacterium]
MTLFSRITPDAATRPRLLWLGLSSVAAVAIGFVLVPPKVAEGLIRQGGYYYMLGLFGAFVYYARQVARAREAVWRGWLRSPGWVGVALLAATAFTLWSDTYQHKILFDEYVLQATGFHMHATKEVGTVIRAYNLDGTWVPIDTFLDKRPYFFTFLLSLAHDLTGYRIANAFILNSALAAAFLALTYWFGRQLTDRTGGLLAVALLASMPLLGQNATCAGMEMHNLTMLLLVMCLALLYLRAPDPDRLALLCLGAVLLAQSRYESAIYVVPVAIVILLGWWRAGAVLLPWATVLTPLLLVPYAWHNRVLSATPVLWQLQEGQTSRFSTEYLATNLRGAVHFFFNFGPTLANSWYLSVLGFAGLVWLAFVILRWFRSRPPVRAADVVALAFGAGVAGNFVLVQFYYWSRLDDTVTSRFALPATLMLALAAAAFVCRMRTTWPVRRIAFAGVAVFVLVSALPDIATRLYTAQNLAMKEIDWERDFVLRRSAGPRLILSNKSAIPWILWQIPSLDLVAAKKRGDQIRYHLAQGTFREVLVTQALRPTTPEGRFGLDPDDELPPTFHLETLAIKRFGGRMERLSRIVSVDPAPPAPPAKPAS